MNVSKKEDFIIKLTIALICIFLWILYRFYFLSEEQIPWSFHYPFKDQIVMILLEHLTRYLSQNVNLMNVLIVFCSTILDFFFLVLVYHYAFKGNSWGPFLNIICFYFLRSLIQNLVFIPIIDSYIFLQPGFISIVVPYGRTSDFFYSGHAGISLLILVYMKDFKLMIMHYLAYFILVIESFLMIVSHSHYTIDIVFGIMTAHYFYIMAPGIGYVFDKRIPILGNAYFMAQYVKQEQNEFESNDQFKCNYSINKDVKDVDLATSLI